MKNEYKIVFLEEDPIFGSKRIEKTIFAPSRKKANIDAKKMVERLRRNNILSSFWLIEIKGPP